MARGRHQKLYKVIAITQCYVFALSHNASTLRRKVVASYCYRSGLIEIVIVSYSYRSGSVGIALAHNSYCFKVINYRFLHRSPLITTATQARVRGIGGGDRRGKVELSNMHLDV